MSKDNLRKKLIYLRKTNFKDKGINFVQFKSILKKLNLKKKNINIGGYYPINSEITCLDILEKLEKKNYKISLPITKKNNDMDFYEWSFQNPLTVGYQGLPEPNFKSLIGGFKIMKFTGHSSFNIEEKFKNQKLSLIFKRIGINWKIVRIELPNNLFDKLSKNLI